MSRLQDTERRIRRWMIRLAGSDAWGAQIVQLGAARLTV